MKRTTKRLIIISLSILVVILMSVGHIVFSLYFGNWWDRPSVGNDVKSITVRGGGFIPPGSDIKNIVLSANSEECQRILKSIESGWKYEQFVKFGSVYFITVTHTDSSEDYIRVGHHYLSVRSSVTDKTETYRTMHDVSERIESEIGKIE